MDLSIACVYIRETVTSVLTKTYVRKKKEDESVNTSQMKHTTEVGGERYFLFSMISRKMFDLV